MTIATLEQSKKLFDSLIYGRVKLEGEVNEPVLYDKNPTPLQRLIEEKVTGGRGYLSLGEALSVINKKSYICLGIENVYSRGLVPIKFYEENLSKDNNPCCEIPLGEWEETPYQMLRSQPTLLERLFLIKIGTYNRGF